MTYSLAALAVAAHRAKDVAALVDAARVLTFLANTRARECLARPQLPGAKARRQVETIYHTASHLAAYGRELAAETEQLLLAAERAEPERDEFCWHDGDSEADIETLRTLLVASMTEAGRAIDMLESIQEIGAEELQVGTLGSAAMVERQRETERLIDRLRRRA
jgi:hypothetical protein